MPDLPLYRGLQFARGQPMDWKKSPESLIALFDEVAPRDAPVERRKMFGYPAAFVHGHMFGGLFQDHLVLRLPDDERAEFMALPGAAAFEPMPGRPMKGYVVAPDDMLEDRQSLRAWLDRSLRFASSLPPKPGKG
jgi:TfoX/Sxy family transcriptional regulator of competence genes